MAREVVITCDQCGKRIRCVAIVYKPHPYDEINGRGDEWFCNIVCMLSSKGLTPETWLQEVASRDAA